MAEAMKKKISKNQRWLSRLLLVISLLLIASGVALYFKSHRDQLKPPAQAAVLAPKSTKLSQEEINNYEVPPANPRYIFIPKINVSKTRVKALGINKNGEVAVPDNIYDAGWYTGSVKPGQIGAMFIFGHISSWQANGIFHDLNKLKAGDLVTVERGDGKKYTYAVNSSKIYQADKVDMNQVLKPITPGTAGLNLMTCAGKVKPGTSEFTERLVVFTTLKN